jgi:DNA-damage-inducible protein J
MGPIHVLYLFLLIPGFDLLGKDKMRAAQKAALSGPTIVLHLIWRLNMAKTAYLNARIDQNLKAEAETVFEKIGLTSSQAITLFYKQVALQQGLPFQVRVPNSETLTALREAEQGGGELYPGSASEVFDRILAEE